MEVLRASSDLFSCKCQVSHSFILVLHQVLHTLLIVFWENAQAPVIVEFIDRCCCGKRSAYRNQESSETPEKAGAELSEEYETLGYLIGQVQRLSTTVTGLQDELELTTRKNVQLASLITQLTVRLDMRLDPVPEIASPKSLLRKKNSQLQLPLPPVLSVDASATANSTSPLAHDDSMERTAEVVPSAAPSALKVDLSGLASSPSRAYGSARMSPRTFGLRPTMNRSLIPNPVAALAVASAAVADPYVDHRLEQTRNVEGDQVVNAAPSDP